MINGGSNVDRVFIDALLVHGTTTIKLLAGNDFVTIDDSAFLGTALFDSGADNDDFFIEVAVGQTGLTSFGGRLKILGGAGDDGFLLGDLGNPSSLATFLVINGAKTTWNGGPGSDSLINDLVPGTNFVDNGTAPNIINGP